MPEETSNPASATPQSTESSESNIPGTTDHSPKDNLARSKQHLREAGDALRANLESSKDHVKQAADELRAAAESKAQEFRDRAENRAHDIRDRAENAYSDARARARTFQEDGEEYVRQNPTQSILAALAAGFVLGLIIRR